MIEPQNLADIPDAPTASAPPPAAVTPSLSTSDDFVAHINAMTDDTITAEQITAVLAAANAATAGEAVGTVLRDDTTGAVAVRVDQHGVHQWRVMALDGATWNDMQPTLPWTKVHTP